jgi:hypothetical protein
MMTRALAAMVVALTLTACGRPDAAGLRESFAQQVASNRFIRDFQRNGDDLTFSGPGTEGGVAKWRIHIDSAVVESNDDPKTAATLPYKGVIKSSWYANDQLILPSGRDSNLPFELTSNGVVQDCWAFWDPAAKRWGWE